MTEETTKDTNTSGISTTGEPDFITEEAAQQLGLMHSAEDMARYAEHQSKMQQERMLAGKIAFTQGLDDFQAQVAQNASMIKQCMLNFKEMASNFNAMVAGADALGMTDFLDYVNDNQISLHFVQLSEAQATCRAQLAEMRNIALDILVLECVEKLRSETETPAE